MSKKKIFFFIYAGILLGMVWSFASLIVRICSLINFQGSNFNVLVLLTTILLMLFFVILGLAVIPLLTVYKRYKAENN